jgi:hypothetical protein
MSEQLNKETLKNIEQLQTNYHKFGRKKREAKKKRKQTVSSISGLQSTGECVKVVTMHTFQRNAKYKQENNSATHDTNAMNEIYRQTNLKKHPSTDSGQVGVSSSG